MRALVTATVALMALGVPWAAPASGESASPPALVVGFYEMPGAEVGGSYAGARIRHVDEALRFVSVEPSDPDAFLERTRGDDRVRYVEPDLTLRALFTPNDPRYASGEQYGPQRIGAPLAWDKTLGSTAVHVCIIDSGVMRTHEDIANARYLGGIDLVQDDAEPNDQDGHGTMITGLAVGATNNAKGIAGVAQAGWSHARVLGAGSGTVSDGASGIRWCADFGAHIASASLGAPGSSTTLNDAVAYVWGKGTLFVAATGNDGCLGSGCVYTPANAPLALAVGCTTSGNTRCSISNGGPEIDLAAPGENVVGPWIGSPTTYVRATGTSASAPLVAGTAALMKSFSPNLTNAQMRDRLEDTALDRGAAGWDQLYGHGLVRADLAMFNAAPSIASMTCTPSTAATWRTVSCSIAASDIEGNGIAAEIDWGDGNSARVPATGFVSAGTPIVATHPYASPGAFAIAALVRDDPADSLASAVSTRNVTVVPNTAPPTPTLACSPSPSAVGDDVVCSLSSADDSDGVAFELDWGDGTLVRVPAAGFALPGSTITAAHAYLDADLFEISARAVDDATPPLESGRAFLFQETQVCGFAATGEILLGAAGVAVDGVTKQRVSGIPAGCGRIGYVLTAQGPAADVDVCWLRAGLAIRCDVHAGPEAGFVPEGADGADVILAQGVDATFALTIPGDVPSGGGEVPPAEVIAIIRDDDGEVDDLLDLDASDDAATKDFVVAPAHLAQLPSRATLQIYGQSYGCGNTATMLLSVNLVPVSLVSPCAKFPRNALGWASFDIPVQLLVVGVVNHVELEELLTSSDFEANNVWLGLDTDATTGRSFAFENGVELQGELMWRLKLER